MTFRSLDELTPDDAALVGGKTWNCARLKQRGFPVPDGVAIPAVATDADIAALPGLAWFDRFPPDERYAVRSSGLSEDSADQSFAGVHETFLDVPREDLVEAVKRCRASADSDRAKAYRATRGLPPSATAAGVLVQQMIHPLAAGVAFTIDPLTGGSDELVINSASGLGVAVVDGQIDPDEIRVQKRDHAVVSQRTGGATAPSIGVAQIQELSQLLTAVEREYGAPQDVEWCYDGTRFWIVQSRPITVAASSASDTEWTRANLAEVLPELTSPQALTAIEEMLNIAERHYMGGLLAPYEQLGPMVKSFYGRMYFNLAQMRHICHITGTAPADVLRSLGHSGEIRPEDEKAPRPPIVAALRCLPDFIRILGRHLRAERIFRAQQVRMANELAPLLGVDPATLPDAQIWQKMLDWQKRGPQGMEAVLLFGGVLFHELGLRKICEKVGFPFDRLLYTHLAAGERSVSAQQAFDLVALADTARADPAVSSWLGHPDVNLAGFRTALRGTMFLAEFERFLERYGHRGLYESDWALPRYSEDPSPLLTAIAVHLRSPDEHRAAVLARVESEAASARSEFEQRMTGLRRWTLLRRARRLLTTIKHYYVWREQCRSDMVRVMAVARTWQLVLARRFVERGWIDRPEHYFQLHMDEITRVLADPARSSGLRAIVHARLADRERYRRLTMPMLMRESELPRLLRASGVTAPIDNEGGDLTGTPVSRGSVEGEVVVITDPGDFARMKRGAILVTRATDPSWTPLFTLASGVIVEVGGVLSHASTIAREYGIPALANVRHATRRLKSGDRILLNATEGFARKLR